MYQIQLQTGSKLISTLDKELGFRVRVRGLREDPINLCRCKVYSKVDGD